MLILSRRNGEKILLSIEGRKPIEVVVSAIRGNVVRLGFEAEKDVVILREEVARVIQKAKEAKP